MSLGKQVLVVDDDQSIRELLSEYLSKVGFNVISAEDGISMTECLKRNQPDLIILDVMLPGDDGFTLCSFIRQSSQVPIIMLTAASDEVDRVTGLEIGADDYVTKTFSPRELLARIKAIFRRSKMTNNSEQRFISFADWTLDSVSRLLISPAQQNIKLSGSDFSLLSLFLKNSNNVLSRDEIALQIWGREMDPLERGIDVQISRLRGHLQDKQHKIIMTVRNEGYVFVNND